jgi:hypothetical protein
VDITKLLVNIVKFQYYNATLVLFIHRHINKGKCFLLVIFGYYGSREENAVLIPFFF